MQTIHERGSGLPALPRPKRNLLALTLAAVSTVAASSALTNAAPALVQGFLTAERWENIGGNTGTGGIDDLKAAIAAGAPTVTAYVPGPNLTQTSPNIDNFGSRMWGWVKADITGDYDFFTSSDDPSQVFLNPAAAASGTNALPNISTDSPIAEEDSCCNAFAEPSAGTTRTTSSPIHLEAGKLYGIVILQKEGGGGDYVKVAWRLTTDTTAAASLQPIPAANCWTLITSNGQTATISQQPQSTTSQEGQAATFKLGLTTSGPGKDPNYPDLAAYAVQWLLNGTNIPGATASTYTTPILALSDSGEKYSAHVYTMTGAVDTATATLTVGPDTTPPTVLGATAFPDASQVGITFSEALDTATAGTAANYKVNGAAVTAATVRTNLANELTNEKNLVQLTVATPLTTNFTVTVSGVKDVKGNAMSSTTINGQILNLTSTDIGSPADQPGGPDPLFPSKITTWGPGAFDVYCNGNDYWNNADGFNFLWEPKTNSFDVKVRVVSVTPTDNWAAGAIEIREGPPTASGKGWELARHYFVKVDYGGPDPSLHGTGSGANAYEFNGRLAPGDPTVRETGNGAPGGSVGWGGAGPGNPGPPPYPNAWIRIKRDKQGTNDHLIAFTASTVTVPTDTDWSQRMDVDLNDATHAGFLDLNGNPAGKWPDVSYVGLGSTSHTGVGNPPENNDGTVGSTWYSPVGQPFGAYIIYRDFGDTAAVTPPPGGAPTLSYALGNDGTVTLTYTGNLYSSDTANGKFTAVSGATSPYKVTPKSGKPATFYISGQ